MQKLSCKENIRNSALALIMFICMIVGSNAQEVPFTRGVNLTGWFQVDSPGAIQFTRYTREDLEQIKSLGCDVIRLPINLHAMTDGAPDYVLHEIFLQYLDEVVKWAEELEVYLILDNHTFDPNANTLPSIGPVLEKVWAQMAEHYVTSSTYLMYEILNEPHGISDAIWNNIQMDVIDAIRARDTTHTIVVGGSGFNGYYNLSLIPDLGDDNLIYTFHFYDPFLFTHQGATWVEPSMQPLANVPFPYEADLMPPMPGSLTGSWVHTLYNNYPTEGNIGRVKELIDIAVEFRDSRQLPVFCGEFGVYIPNSDQSERAAWYEVVRTHLEQNQIPWTIWDYHGGFGVFEGGSNGLFEHDLNVELLEVLGLNVPDQTAYIPMPDSTGFEIYTDLIGPDIISAGNGGVQNFLDEGSANYGKYAIDWTSASQYNAIGFDFIPDRDMTHLVDAGYALDLFVKSEIADLAFDLRFLDSKSSSEDRPWRMHYVVDDELVTWDGSWQHLHIPLRNFTEHGAWDDQWFEPIGLYDWSKVDRMEISTEYSGIGLKGLQLDHIVVTDLDTAAVNETTRVVERGIAFDYSIRPNPASETLTLELPTPSPTRIQVIDLLGRIVKDVTVQGPSAVDISELRSAVYLVRMQYHNSVITHKIVKR